MITIKIEKDFGKHKKGDRIKVDDNNGIPLSKWWRDRIKDSKIDGCVSIVEPPKKRKKQQENEE